MSVPHESEADAILFARHGIGDYLPDHWPSETDSILKMNSALARRIENDQRVIAELARRCQALTTRAERAELQVVLARAIALAFAGGLALFWITR